MLIIVGVFNVLDGLVAIFNANYFENVVGEESIVMPVVDDIAAWGWLVLVIGAVLLGTGFGVLAGATWARVLGVVLAGFNMVVQLAFVAHYPFWALSIIAVDALVIYGLLAREESEYYAPPAATSNVTQAEIRDTVPR
jgi:hypothetical protein